MVIAPPRSRFHLDADQVQFFDNNGYLILRNWVTGRLLEGLQDAGHHWIEDGLAHGKGSDYQFAKREIGEVFFRVDYLHDKGNEVSLALLGSPEVLGVAESLLGPNLVPTYESMVFKQAGDGEAIRWHQDAVHDRKYRVFNYDLYLDPSIAGAGALRVIPGTQRQPIDACELERQFGWDHPDAIDVEMQPGDVLLHDTMVVHGSARVMGKALRRTIYYEFRSAEMISEVGPWDREWLDRRMRLIPLGLREYARQFPNEPGFDWRPSPQFRQEISPEDDLRVAHVVHSPGSYCSAAST